MSCPAVETWWGFWLPQEHAYRHVYRAILKVACKYLPLSEVLTQSNRTLIAFNKEDTKKLEDAWQKGVEELIYTEGTRFQVDVRKMQRTSTYWVNSPTLEVVRHTWFIKERYEDYYRPVDVETSAMLEDAYRSLVEWKDKRVKINVSNHSYLEINKTTGELLYYEDRFLRCVYKDIIRGCPKDWKGPVSDPGEIKHIAFVCHGVGTVADLTFRSMPEILQEDVINQTQGLLDSHFPEKTSLKGLEYIPICWHRDLHTDELKKAFDTITPKGIARFRKIMRVSVSDVILYFTPYYCEVILSTVAKRMNAIYENFIQLNPNFNGTISLIGHSLGGVILFDLLGHQIASTEEVIELSGIQDTDQSEVPSRKKIDKETLIRCNEEYLRQLGISADVGKEIGEKLVDLIQDSLKTHGHSSTLTTNSFTSPWADFKTHPQYKLSNLIFKPNCFFSLGAPISAVLCMRKFHSISPDFRLPTCPVFANIYHPIDPFGFRFETMIDPHVGAPATLPVDAAGFKKIFDLKLKGNLNSGKKVDYILPKSLLSSLADILLTDILPIVTSHTCYWNSPETFLFILKTIQSQCKDEYDQN